MTPQPATVSTPRLIPEVLAEYGTLTQQALLDYLPAGEPQAYLYDLIADYPLRSGKMMRSSLCVATARAFGARVEDALCSAASIELLHNALLIHDDIEDASEERRGRPTLHALHGIPLALNAGDSLCLLSLRPLLDNIHRIGPGLAMEIFRETERMAWESAEGQALELGWRRDNATDLTDEDYLTMVLKKTCWLAIIHPSRVGALIGTRGRMKLEPFIRFGFFLGATFQIQDDLLNLGADTRYGKEPDGDIWEGKRTLMLNHLLRKATAVERCRMEAMLALPREQRTAEQVGWIRERMDHYGSVKYARGIAHGLAGAALHEYSEIYRNLPDSRDKQFIRGLVTWVFERTSGSAP
ncbi:polyprenyl synthetase family protein [Methylolobus aquaticus]